MLVYILDLMNLFWYLSIDIYWCAKNWLQICLNFSGLEPIQMIRDIFWTLWLIHSFQMGE